MSTDANLPSDLRDSDLDPKICEQCQISENRIEDMQDALSDALDYLHELEVETRWKDNGGPANDRYRKDLLACIERVKKLA